LNKYIKGRKGIRKKADEEERIKGRSKEIHIGRNRRKSGMGEGRNEEK
jgi:hypothetical protein